MAATPLISATTLARAIGISNKSGIALLESFVREGIAVEVTHRAARRLSGLKALGEEVRRAVHPPYHPRPDAVWDDRRFYRTRRTRFQPDRRPRSIRFPDDFR
jgi:hypothetical protein